MQGSGTAVRVVHPIECPELGPICEVRDEPPQQHDQTFTLGELRPTVEYGFTDVWSLELQVPMRVSATRIMYLHEDGTHYTPDYVDIHHRDETLVGIGDPWLSVRARQQLWGIAWAGRLGVTVPLGRTEPNPFALGDAGLSHQHVQFGTGTWSPLLGLDAAREVGPVMLAARVEAMLSLYENGHGYLAGTRLLSGVEGQLTLIGKLRGGLTFDVFHEQPERWDGEIQQDGNLGRTDLLVGATLSHPIGALLLTLTVKVPVYQHLVGVGPEAGQLSYPAIGGISVQQLFDVAR